MSDLDKYELFLRVADDEDECVYLNEEWFENRPAVETIAALFEEAKRDFAALYPGVEAGDFSVEVRRLRPRDNHRPPARTS